VRLGRHGQLGGRYRGTLAVDHAGEPLVRHVTVLDGSDAALCGPAGTARQRLVAGVLGAGVEPVPPLDPAAERDGVRWARHELAGPGWLLLAVGDDSAGMARLVGTAGAANSATRTDGKATNSRALIEPARE
ncbi:MAG: hypothetical protein J2P19_26425, partial [Pseudonocardia sp.]|nr:hypothetical protein [Pseudonocardia sp.]